MRFGAPRLVFVFLFYFVVCWVVVVLLRARALAAAFPRGVLSCGGLWPPLGAGAPGLPFCWGGRRCRCRLACCGRSRCGPLFVAVGCIFCCCVVGGARAGRSPQCSPRSIHIIHRKYVDIFNKGKHPNWIILGAHEERTNDCKPWVSATLGIRLG